MRAAALGFGREPARAISRASCCSGRQARDDDASKSRFVAGLEEQRDVGDRRRRARVRRCLELFEPASSIAVVHLRMDDRLEVAPRAGVGEHDAGRAPRDRARRRRRARPGRSARRPPRSPACRARRPRARARRRRSSARRARRTARGSTTCRWRCRRSARRERSERLTSLQWPRPAGISASVSVAGVMRSSTNVFHSWQCGHCQSSSVLR